MVRILAVVFATIMTLPAAVDAAAGEGAFMQPPVEINDATRDGRFNELYHQMKRNAKIGNWKLAFQAFDGLQKTIDAFTREYVLPAGEGQYVSARDIVFATVAAFPDNAFKIYREKADPEAKKQFDIASRQSDAASMVDVAYKFFFTSYGDDALAAGARRAFEAGEYALVLSLTRDLFRYCPKPDIDTAGLHMLAAAAAARGCDVTRLQKEIEEAKAGPAKAYYRGREVAVTDIIDEITTGFGKLKSKAEDAAKEFDFEPGDLRAKCDLLAMYLSDELKERYRHWSLDHPSCVVPTPAEDDLSLIIQTPVRLNKFDLFYGREEWSVMLRRSDYPPLWRNALYRPALAGKVIVVSTGKTVRAYNLSDGKFLWDAAKLKMNKEFFKDVQYISSPVFAEGRLYMTVTKLGNVPESFVLCLDGGCRTGTATGEMLWQTFCCKTGAANPFYLGAPVTPPAVGTGVCYAVTNLGAVAAINAFDGKIIWLATYPRMTINLKEEAVEEEKRWAVSPPAISEGRLITAPCDAVNAYAFNTASGKISWSFPRLPGLRYLAGAADGIAVFTGGKAVALKSKTGQVAWRAPFSGKSAGRATVVRDYVYIPLDTGVRKLLTKSGKESGNFHIGRGNVIPIGADLAIAEATNVRVYSPKVKRRTTKKITSPDELFIRAKKARLAGDDENAFDLVTTILDNRRTILTFDLRNGARRLASELAGELAAKETNPDRRIEYLRRRVAYEPVIPARIRADFDIAEEFERLERYGEAVAEYERLAVRHHGFELLVEPDLRLDAGVVALYRAKTLRREPPRPYPPPGSLEPQGGFAAPVEVLWRTGTELVGYSRKIVPVPGAENSGLFFVRTASHFEARERDTGLPRWRIKLDGFDLLRTSDAPPRVVAVGSSLFIAGEKKIRRLDLTTGKAAWRREILDLGDKNTPIAETAKSIAAGKGVIAIGTMTGAVHLLNASDGGKIWSATGRRHERCSLSGPPIISGDRLLLFVNGQRSTCEVVGFSLKNGSELFRVAPPRDVPIKRFNQPPMIMPDGRILVIIMSQRFFTLDPREKKPALKPMGDIAKRFIRYGRDVKIAGDKLLVFYDDAGIDTLAAFNEEGTELWRKKLTSPPKPAQPPQPGGRTRVLPPPPPVTGRVRDFRTDGKYVYVIRQRSGNSHEIIAYNAATGRELWKWPGPNAITGRVDGDIHVADGYVITTTYRKLILGETERILKAFPTPSDIGAIINLLDAKTGKPISRLFVPARIRYDFQLAHHVQSTALIGGVLAVLTDRGYVGFARRDEKHVERTAIAAYDRLRSIPEDLHAGTRLVAALCALGQRGPAIRIADRLMRSEIASFSHLLTPSPPGRKKQAKPAEKKRAKLERKIKDLKKRLERRSEKDPDPYPPREETEDDSREDTGRDKAEADLYEAALGEIERNKLVYTMQLAELIQSAAEVEGSLSPPIAYAHRFSRKPAVDGKIDDSYRQHEGYRLGRLDYLLRIQGEDLIPLPWRGREDLSAKMYVGWDNEYFYFALDVMDSQLRAHDREASEWMGDLLFIAFDFRDSNTPQVDADDTLLHLGFMKPRKKEQSAEEKKREEENRPDGEYMIRRKDEDNSGAIYECAIPWQMFWEHLYGRNEENWVKPEDRPPRDSFRFGFNLTLIDDDSPTGTGAVKTVSWTPGLIMTKEKTGLFRGFLPYRFGTVVLINDLPEPEEEEEEEEEKEPGSKDPVDIKKVPPPIKKIPPPPPEKKK